MEKKRVYTFGNGQAEGKADMRNLLGGKGANLAEMNLIGVPVPPGFTITTEVCNEYFEKGKEFLKDILIDEYTQTEDLLKYANKKINITKMEKCNYNNLDIYIVNIEYDKESTDIVVFSDYSNSTYSIMPKEYFNDIENIQSIIKNLDIKYIDKNKNNEIKKVELTDQQICLQYYSDYIDLIKYHHQTEFFRFAHSTYFYFLKEIPKHFAGIESNSLYRQYFF